MHVGNPHTNTEIRVECVMLRGDQWGTGNNVGSHWRNRRKLTVKVSASGGKGNMGNGSLAIMLSEAVVTPLLRRTTAENAQRKYARKHKKSNRSIHTVGVATPNEPKLSHGGGWRGLCRWAERWRRSAAQAVTAVAVGCSAWLGVRLDSEKVIRVRIEFEDNGARNASIAKICLGQQRGEPPRSGARVNARNARRRPLLTRLPRRMPATLRVRRRASGLRTMREARRGPCRSRTALGTRVSSSRS